MPVAIRGRSLMMITDRTADHGDASFNDCRRQMYRRLFGFTIMIAVLGSRAPFLIASLLNWWVPVRKPYAFRCQRERSLQLTRLRHRQRTPNMSAYRVPARPEVAQRQ